jgi:hypothetical protein
MTQTMIDSVSFKRIVETAFAPFLLELGFSADPVFLSGKYCAARFACGQRSLLISYEPGDDELLIVISERPLKSLPDIDNRLAAPRLSDLNRAYGSLISVNERSANDARFGHVQTRNGAEKNLLNCAKQLRLVLPKYVADHS